MFIRHEQAVDAIDQIADEAEAAGLLPVAIDGEGLAADGLLDEVRYHTTVIQAHARAKSVEDTYNAGIEAVVAVVGHCEGFSEAFGFVVHRAHTNGVYVAPVSFFLGMLQRVAIDLAGGGQQVASIVSAGHSQGIMGAQRPRFHGLNRQIGVAVGGGGVGAGRRGEVQDGLYLAGNKDKVRHIVTDKGEIGVSGQVFKVVRAAGNEVVHSDDEMTLINQLLAQVRTQEAGCAGD